MLSPTVSSSLVVSPFCRQPRLRYLSTVSFVSRGYSRLPRDIWLEGSSVVTSRNGKVLQVVGTRLCQRCRSLTKHTSFSVRYNAAPSDSNRILKTFRWVCSRCGEEAEVTSDVLVPSDRARFIARILRMQDDYDIRSMSILADCGQLRIQIAFGNTREEST